jgi:hypothetical protein
LTAVIGAASVGMGSFQYVSPRRATRRFGIRLGSDESSTIMVRAAGARDCLTGSTLVYLAARGGDYRPWLATRAVADAADGIAGALSLRAGTRCAKQAATTRRALLLSAVELLLWRMSLHSNVAASARHWDADLARELVPRLARPPASYWHERSQRPWT